MLTDPAWRGAPGSSKEDTAVLFTVSSVLFATLAAVVLPAAIDAYTGRDVDESVLPR